MLLKLLIELEMVNDYNRLAMHWQCITGRRFISMFPAPGRRMKIASETKEKMGEQRCELHFTGLFAHCRFYIYGLVAQGAKNPEMSMIMSVVLDVKRLNAASGPKPTMNRRLNTRLVW